MPRSTPLAISGHLSVACVDGIRHPLDISDISLIHQVSAGGGGAGGAGGRGGGLETGNFWKRTSYAIRLSQYCQQVD